MSPFLFLLYHHMPQASAFVAKDASNEDVPFRLQFPAAGDNTPARWQNPVGLTSVSYPTVDYVTKANSANTVRTGTLRVQVPFTVVEPQSGLPLKVSSAMVKVEFVAPTNYPEEKFADVLAIATSTLSNAMFVGAMKTQNQPLT